MHICRSTHVSFILHSAKSFNIICYILWFDADESIEEEQEAVADKLEAAGNELEDAEELLVTAGEQLAAAREQLEQAEQLVREVKGEIRHTNKIYEKVKQCDCWFLQSEIAK